MSHVVAVDSPAFAQRRALHDEMIAGWRASLLSGGVKPATIDPMVRTIERLVAFDGVSYAWEWTPRKRDRWGEHLALNLALTTARSYQGYARQFMEFLTDPADDWVRRCREMYNADLRQLFHRRNTIPHTWIYEGNPERRPLTDEEVARLFAGILEHMNEVRARGCKGWLEDARDYAWIAVVLAYGLRSNESRLLCLFDFGEADDDLLKERYDRYGALEVRHGKAKRRGKSRRRTVLTIPLYAFVVSVLQWYVNEIRPQFPVAAKTQHALWLTERGTIPGHGYFGKRFKTWIRRLGLPEELTLHFLRHTYVTRSIEDDYTDAFVQDQVGHEDPRSTSIYTSVGNSFKRDIVRENLERATCRLTGTYAR